MNRYASVLLIPIVVAALVVTASSRAASDSNRIGTDGDGLNEAALELLVWDETAQAWITAQATCVLPMSPVRQTGSNKLIVSACAEGEFALTGGSYQLYLPIVERS